MISPESPKTPKEFDPTSLEDRSNPATFAEWLKSNKARLDATKSHGNVATALVVEDKEHNGYWRVSLHGGIDVVNENDYKFMTSMPAWILVEPRNKYHSVDDQENPTVVKVSYLGVDDETRDSEIDVTEEPEFVLNQ
jgi:hypothetical protein